MTMTTNDQIFAAVFLYVMILVLACSIERQDQKIQKMRDEIESLKASNAQVWKVFDENRVADRVRNNLGLIPTEQQKQSKIKY